MIEVMFSVHALKTRLLCYTESLVLNCIKLIFVES